MVISPTEVSLEAAFALAVARDESLRRLLQIADRELVKLVWSFAYLDGVDNAYKRALDNTMRPQ